MRHTIAFFVSSVPIGLDQRDGRASLGGSESACFGLARALSRAGHRVHIHAQHLAEDARGVDADGVTWHDAGPDDATVYGWCDVVEPDVFVSLRMPHIYRQAIRARFRALWNQDLLMPGHEPAIATIAWQLDALIYVSAYHRQQWEGVAPDLARLPAYVTRNGFDPAHVPTDVAKVPGRICYITRPERGLAPLLEMWPALKAAVPHAELHVTRYGSMYDGEGSAVAQMCAAYDQMTAAVQAKVGGIVTHPGGLGKADLYALIASSEVMWYPGVADFAETSCWTPDTQVAVPGGHKRIDQVQSGDLVLSYSEDEKCIVAKRVKWCKRTGVNKAVMRLTYKWRFGRKAGRQESITGTPNHQMLRRDGTWVALGDLRPGDSLMPMFRKSDGKYWEIGHNGKSYRYEHDITGEAIVGRPLESGEIVHHRDSNGLNNDESNLAVWQQSDHIRHHLPEMKAAYKANRPSFDYERMYALRRDGLSQRAIAGAMGTYQQDIARKLASANHSVVSLEPAGFSDVWDMEVEDTHTFIAGHVVVHNCVAAVEAQACGTYFVGSFKGALPETVPAGWLLHGDASSEEYQRTSRHMVSLALAGEDADRLDAGRDHVRAYTYDAIAADWSTWLDATFVDRYEAHTEGVLRQLLQYDDHVAALQVTAQGVHALSRIGAQVSVDADRLRDARVFCQRVIAGEDQTAEDYGDRAIPDPILEADTSTRLRSAAESLVGCRRVLDVACGNGALALALARLDPAVTVLGLDYSAANITRAREAAQALGVADRVTFVETAVYDFSAQTSRLLSAVAASPQPGASFDGAFIGEFLEHIAHPEALLTDVARLAPGGRVICTMPSGPWTELMPPDVPIKRGHVHHFAYDDIHAIFGAQPDLQIGVLDCGVTPRGAGVASWVITYRADPAIQVGTRDLDHRILTTRPMPRLSVGLIVREGDRLELPRCLETVRAIADEIVIGVCGDGPRVTAIATEAGARVLALPPVADLDGGFAEARNRVLDACTGEWFLWIDADEQLVGSTALRSYLDTPYFAGYSLRQQHLQVDADRFYDEPIRLFRRDAGARFCGVVHEQPQVTADGNGDLWPVLGIVETQIAHYGYLVEGVRRQKSQARNLPLLLRDRQRYPDRELGRVLWMREFATWLGEIGAHRPTYLDALRVLVAEAGDPATVSRDVFDGQPIPASGEALARFAVNYFERHFPDMANLRAQLARPFYEAALRVLPEAWQVDFAFAAQQGGLRGRAKPKPFWTRSIADTDAMIRLESRKLSRALTPTPVHTDPFDAPVAVADEPAPTPEPEAVPA